MSGKTTLPQQPKERAASPGQVIIMAALLMVALMGMLGLAVDLGFAFAERRTMQSAADAGALAGTRIVAKSLPSARLSALTEVTTAVNGNKIGSDAATITECVYVDDDDVSLGGCDDLVPTTATGVRVTVEETHDTTFIRVVPGAPNEVTTRATATAHVLMLGAPRDGPFLVCAVNTQLAAGGTMDILVESGGNWIINPSAIGLDFKIHGPQIEKCNAKASRFKGVADQDANRTKTTPGWFSYKEGDTAGPVSADVDGAEGCQAGQEVVNCIAFLPIVIDNPSESGNSKELWTIAFAPFYITAPKSNEHWGTPVVNYIVTGSGQSGSFGWYQGYLGPIVVRLTV